MGCSFVRNVAVVDSPRVCAFKGLQGMDFGFEVLDDGCDSAKFLPQARP